MISLLASLQGHLSASGGAAVLLSYRYNMNALRASSGSIPTGGMKNDLAMVQFPYVRHYPSRWRLVLVRWEGLREPPCGDLGRWHHLHLRQQRQRHRDRLSGLHLGLAQPPGERREKRRRHHLLRLRSHRPAGVQGDGDVRRPSIPATITTSPRDRAAATTTKHIFSPDGTLLATVVGASTTASTTYLHPDHLGGTNVTTDEDGEVTQTLDYYPYGSQRIATGSFSEQRRFIGEEYDPDTEFSYLNARYYQGSRGQFMSQDPVFWEAPKKQLLADPQTFNSYSYAVNNPIIKKDPDGKQYINANVNYTVPIYGIPVGPMVGAYSTPSNVYISIGLTATPKIGPSYSVSASPDGDVSEGWGGGFNLFSKFPSRAAGVGGQIGFGQNSNDNFRPSIDGGFGTQGRGVSIYYTIELNKLLNALGGQFSHITTPQTMSADGKQNSKNGAAGSTSSLKIGNSIGGFAGSYNFGPEIGTYNFGTQSWISPPTKAK